jgi:hypothetical protein
MQGEQNPVDGVEVYIQPSAREKLRDAVLPCEETEPACCAVTGEDKVDEVVSRFAPRPDFRAKGSDPPLSRGSQNRQSHMTTLFSCFNFFIYLVNLKNSA